MKEPLLSDELISKHGLKQDEYSEILKILNREPTFTELGIFSAMWNEHCSYKSSKKWLRDLPSTGKQVVCGPGENAGIVDIGDGQAIVFKMESHNHPSYIEPYQGAATGVGGILRDIFTMGARPIATMNSLSFGHPSHEKTKQLVNGVVAGIGGYGNCFGVPNVGGETRFHPSYNGNCLVNAFAAGLVDIDKIFYSAASGVGMPVVYVGAKTGRDGVGGATMASTEFDEFIEERRPNVQIGDPFTEKRLMEACQELMATDAVISIQDMGAAGLTCSAVEMGDKGNLGIKLDLNKVPTRESDMTPYEMMLSETQERMLMVLKPGSDEEAKLIFEKWDLDFAIIGKTIAEDKFLIFFNDEIKADLPLKALSGNAPEYNRPWTATSKKSVEDKLPNFNPIEGLKVLVSSPNYCKKNWIWEQYDGEVMANTILSSGSSAGIVKIPNSVKAIAFTSDVTPRYVKANPREGGRQAVAEAFRNLTAVGAIPLAITDNLNFGNPEKPEIMGQLVESIKGITDAVKKLDMPVVSGNVSLYNETDGTAILPTPTIGAIGLIKNFKNIINGKVEAGYQALLIGETSGEVGQSAILAEMFKKEEGDCPKVDLVNEKRNGLFIREHASLIEVCTDLSDGGVVMSMFEMANNAGLGFKISQQENELLFGEDQGRYLVGVPVSKAKRLISSANSQSIPIKIIGEFIHDEIQIGENVTSLGELNSLYENSFKVLFS
ncbi:MAG: phosphoribosylformylglycinamidine synthase subunit PurL [Paracoccaceae bacterium]